MNTVIDDPRQRFLESVNEHPSKGITPFIFARRDGRRRRRQKCSTLETTDEHPSKGITPFTLARRDGRRRRRQKCSTSETTDDGGTVTKHHRIQVGTRHASHETDVNTSDISIGDDVARTVDSTTAALTKTAVYGGQQGKRSRLLGHVIRTVLPHEENANDGY